MHQLACAHRHGGLDVATFFQVLGPPTSRGESRPVEHPLGDVSLHSSALAFCRERPQLTRQAALSGAEPQSFWPSDR
jgi:hypothetical protein